MDLMATKSSKMHEKENAAFVPRIFVPFRRSVAVIPAAIGVLRGFLSFPTFIRQG
jgi:hypothetical protein